jgi:uncharacterized lipoprotein YehR (DUF1307 family)
MKKFLFLVLTIFMVVSLTACGSKEINNVQNNNNENTERQEDTTKENTKTKDVLVDEEEKENKNVLNDGVVEEYINVIKTKNYYIKYRMNLDGEQSEIAMAVQNDNIAMESGTGEERTNIIIKDGNTYMVNHNEATVLVTKNGENEATIEEPILAYEDLPFASEGTGDFLGKSCKFKEYDFNGDKVKYYYDDDKVVGMEAVDDSGVYYIEILELSENVPESMFEIPSDYTLMSLEETF